MMMTEQIDRLLVGAREKLCEPYCILMGINTYARFRFEMAAYALIDAESSLPSAYLELPIVVVPSHYYLQLGFRDWMQAEAFTSMEYKI